jgi:hypothetical protein
MSVKAAEPVADLQRVRLAWLRQELGQPGVTAGTLQAADVAA